MLDLFASIALETGLLGSGNINNLVNILFFASFFAFMFFGQQIQSRIALMQIDGAVRKLENMRNDAKGLTLKMLRKSGNPKMTRPPG